MKKIAYFLLVAGFLAGAFATALDARAVNWALFCVAAGASAAGVIMIKRRSRAEARSESVLSGNRSQLNESIARIVSDLAEATQREALRGTLLRDWIDASLRPDLRRFAEARESMVHLYGLQTYADIMSEFAAGERYINRVWSASADGYDDEARDYLHRAAQQFRHAQEQLQAAGAG